MILLKDKIDMILKTGTEILPSSYQRVGYVYPANGYGYIKTDIVHYNAMNYEINMCAKFINFSRAHMFSGWGNCRWFGTTPYKNSDGTYGAIFRSGTAQTSDTPNVELNKYYNWKMLIDNVNKTVTNSIDDRADLTLTASTVPFGTDTYPYLIFRTNNYLNNNLNLQTYTMYIGIKSLEIKGNNKTIAVLIPCYRKSDNQAGFYNAVTDAFYYGNNISYGFD